MAEYEEGLVSAVSDSQISSEVSARSAEVNKLLTRRDLGKNIFVLLLCCFWQFILSLNFFISFKNEAGALQKCLQNPPVLAKDQRIKVGYSS